MHHCLFATLLIFNQRDVEYAGHGERESTLDVRVLQVQNLNHHVYMYSLLLGMGLWLPSRLVQEVTTCAVK
jgi:hypothetical protein